MKHASTRRKKRQIDILAIGVGVTLGVLAMFLLDPLAGKRRRALIRDKGKRLANNGAALLSQYSRHLKNRTEGLLAKTRTSLQHTTTPDDDVLVSRVKSALGRVTRSALNIGVQVNEGEVVLSGPLDDVDVENLFPCVKAVAGVKSVRLQINNAVTH